MFEMSGSQIVVGPNALIQIFSPEGGLIAELKVSTFLLRESVGLDLTAAKLAQAAREAKSFRRVQPRDPTTGRFVSAKVEGCEDGEPATPVTERARATDTTRRSAGGSRFIFVPTDELSNEMVIGDEDTAPSPEDILLACEVDDVFDGEPVLCVRPFEDRGDHGVRSPSFIDTVSSDDGSAEEVVFFSRRNFRDDDWADSHLDDADSFRDRQWSYKRRRRSFSYPNTPERRRHKQLVARMRHARRAAQTWLTKPDWSDEAADLLEDEKVAEIIAAIKISDTELAALETEAAELPEEISALMAEAAA